MAGLVKSLAGWLRVKRNRLATVHCLELRRVLRLAGQTLFLFAWRRCLSVYIAHGAVRTNGIGIVDGPVAVSSTSIVNPRHLCGPNALALAWRTAAANPALRLWENHRQTFERTHFRDLFMIPMLPRCLAHRLSSHEQSHRATLSLSRGRLLAAVPIRQPVP